MSTVPSQIYELIPRVMADIGAVEKNRKNEQQKYQFRGIEDFYQAAHPAFVKHGIFCVPEVLDHSTSSFEKTNDYGKATVWRHVTVKVRHRFFAGDGSFVDAVTIGEGLDNSDKATNKAMSGAMKYALIELFSVPTQDVEDSDRTSPEAGMPQRTNKPIPIPRNPAIGAAQDSSGKGPEKVADQPQEGQTSAGAQAPPQREPGEDDDDPHTFVDEPIDLARQRRLHRAFGDAIRSESAKKGADKILRDWLENEGYVGEDGKGTTKTIPMYLFDEVLRKAVKFAEGLG